jgi:CMP-N-acetylneuraminic acid synthetase
VPGSQPTFLALIPARAGSERVPGKNTRELAGHPLIAYPIAAAHESGLFDRVICSTDSDRTRAIAEHYGAEVPFLRPPELATSTSPDIEWITHLLSELPERYDCFCILRPTSPFRGAQTIARAVERFLELSASDDIDSLRAVRLVKDHPGKMWVLEGDLMRPLLEQSHLEVAWHAGQYQALPTVHVQNSSMEIAWSRVVAETRSREGNVVAPFFTDDVEGFSIDYDEDWLAAERMIASGEATVPRVSAEAFGERAAS